MNLESLTFYNELTHYQKMELEAFVHLTRCNERIEALEKQNKSINFWLGTEKEITKCQTK